MNTSESVAIPDTETVVSQYCFLVGHSEAAGYYLDIYIPEALGAQLQLVPGSSVLLQGLGRGKLPTFYVRARTGLEAPKPDTIPFTATLRFPNQPHMLQRFLQAAREKGVGLQALRTFGYRGEREADVVIEGSTPASEPTFVERHNLRKILSEVVRGLDTTITTAENLKFSGYVEGRVMYSLYYLDLYLFTGRYLKVRVNTRGRTEPFKDNPPKLRPARVRLDFTSLTLTIDPFTDLQHYLLVFSGRDLADQPPVTKTILDTLPHGVNVDALSAYEYVRFDPDQPALPAKPSGRIEMFCTFKGPLDTAGVQASLHEAVAVTLGSKERIEEVSFEELQVRIAAIQRRYAANHRDTGDLEWGLFRKRLHDGRFAYIEHLGAGSFGRVNKYFDLETRAVVAGKHISSHKVRVEELDGLRRELQQRASRHIVRLVDSCYDDDDTVLIMEYVDFTLAAHRDYPLRAKDAPPHGRPGDIEEFVEMAVDLCKGLEIPHGVVDEHGQVLIHGDIKPENIGATLVAGEVCWKLLDFGLARRLPAGARDIAASGITGTLAYMSPQVFRKIGSPLNDIYALGIVLHEVLAGWHHPSKDPRGGHFDRLEIPVEVDLYVRYLEGLVDGEPDGFEVDTSKWRPQFRDGLEDVAVKELAEIIRRMVRMSLDARYQSALEVRSGLESWRKKWLS